MVLLLSCGHKRTTDSDTVMNVTPDSEASADSIHVRSIVMADVDPNNANGGPVDNDAAIRALLKAYSDFIERVERNMVYFKDGSTLPFDDGQKKTFTTLLDNGDIQDMFFLPYSSAEEPRYLADAGRSRSEDLYKKMYGASSAEVEKSLVEVPWFGKTVKFTKINHADEALKKVAADLEKNPDLRKYLESSGTFYWRPVRGAKRMSAHSYGIAFDIAVPYANYWQWDSKSTDELLKIKYNNRIPHEIVEIFEKHGFVWGGAWYHYDTMHFEYRPELIYYSNEVLGS